MLTRLLPNLIRLVDESHDRPVRWLTTTIRKLLLEHGFIDEDGDRLVGSGSPPQVDAMAQLLIGVLEKARQLAIAEDRWSDAPLEPLAERLDVRDVASMGRHFSICRYRNRLSFRNMFQQ